MVTRSVKQIAFYGRKTLFFFAFYFNFLLNLLFILLIPNFLHQGFRITKRFMNIHLTFPGTDRQAVFPRLQRRPQGHQESGHGTFGG